MHQIPNSRLVSVTTERECWMLAIATATETEHQQHEPMGMCTNPAHLLLAFYHIFKLSAIIPISVKLGLELPAPQGFFTKLGATRKENTFPPLGSNRPLRWCALR